jgi:ribosomal-protein-alanine N-acetyltransferase
MISKFNSSLNTRRLCLKPIELKDLQNLYGLWTEPLVKKYFWDDKTINILEIEEVIIASQFSFAENDYGQWSISLKRSGQFIGSAGLLNEQDPFFDVNVFPNHQGVVELIYAILPKYRSQGYATEIVLKIFEYTFKRTKIERIVSIADLPNKASIRVLEKSGMKKYGRQSINGQKIILFCKKSLNV